MGLNPSRVCSQFSLSWHDVGQRGLCGLGILHAFLDRPFRVAPVYFVGSAEVLCNKSCLNNIPMPFVPGFPAPNTPIVKLVIYE